MSKPAPGTYYIVNKTLSYDGQRLAINFTGKDAYVTVTPLTHSASQRWIIADYDAKWQSITPAEVTSLQAGWGDREVIVLLAGGYVWTIRGSDNEYTIQDGGVTVFWGLENAISLSHVAIGASPGIDHKHWILEKAPASKPAAGTYYIVNRARSPGDEKLAITFNGQGAMATVTLLIYSNNQSWTVADYNANWQSLSPASATDLQAGWGDTGVVVLPAGGYVWTIRSSDIGYTIQDGGMTVFWGLESATTNSQISIADGIKNEYKHWILEKV